MFRMFKSFLRVRGLGNTTYIRRDCTKRFRPGLENMEDRSLPSVTLPTPGAPGPVVLTGQNGPDQFRIQLQAGAATNIQFSDDGGQTYSTAALADVTSVTVDGLRGRDSLTVDNSNGLVAEVGGLPITFNGGTGMNTLSVTGNAGGTVSEIFTAGPTARSGALTIGAGTASTTISLNDVSGVFDSTSATGLTINAGVKTGVIDISQGKALNGETSIRVRGPNVDALSNIVDDRRDTFVADDDQQDSDDDESSPITDDLLSDNVGTMPITFTNKTNVTINSGAGSQLFLVNSAQAAVGLQTLTINGGADFDVAAESNLPAGVTVSLQNIERTDITPAAILVDRLYAVRLGRLPSQSELDSWVNILQTAGRLAVVRGIEGSLEARTEMVRDWYTHFLGRIANNGEEQGWVQSLINGASEASVMAGIIGSGEFRARAQNLFQSGDANRNVVLAMYQILLNRSASSAEVDGWVNTMSQFGTRFVALSFLASSEFRDQTVGSFYANFLNRTADFEGRDGWVRSGLDFGDIREAFGDSDEFFGQ